MNHPDPEHVVTKSIIVERDVATTFQVWTKHIGIWWPTSHSISGDPKTQVFIEGSVGGRFYERASNGVEYDWGRVVVWEPPYRVAYTWYLGSNRDLPTRVEVQFTPLSENRTQVEVEHRGPDLIGTLWWSRESIFQASWDSVLTTFALFVPTHIDNEN